MGNEDTLHALVYILVMDALILLVWVNSLESRIKKIEDKLKMMEREI